MNTFSVFDIKTLVNIDEISKFHSQIVTSDFINLNSAFFYIIGTQANENSVSPFFPTAAKLDSHWRWVV